MGKEKDPFETAIRILAPREHSSYQLRKKLQDRNFTTTEIEQTLTKLVELSYLDDLRFARLVIRDRVENKLRSFADAKQRLYQAKVSSEIQQQALEEAKDDINESEICKLAALKKEKSLLEKDPKKRYQKIARYLQNRGFPASMIWETLNEIFNTEV